MDHSYTYSFPSDDAPKKKRPSGRRLLPVLAVILTAVLLACAGIGAYTVLKPPALDRALRRTASDLLGDTDGLEQVLSALIRESERQGSDVTLEGKLPAEVTGGGDFAFELRARTSPHPEDPVARYELALSGDGASPVSFSLWHDSDLWWVTGLYPDEPDRAVTLPKSGIAERLETSAWNPAVGGEGLLTEAEYQSLLELARAVENAEEEGAATLTDAEQKEVKKALRALGKACQRILNPTLERSFSPSLTKTVLVSLDYEKLIEMVAALREVIEDYPAFADLLRSSVTFTEYGESMLPDDAVVQAVLPVAETPSLTPLSAETDGETEEDDLEALLDTLDEWLTATRETCDLTVSLSVSVRGGRLSALDLDWVHDDRAGNREEYDISLTFSRPKAGSDGEQTLAAAALRQKIAWAALEGIEAGSYETGEYVRYTLRDTEREREYLLTVAEDPALAEQEDPLSPDTLSAETAAETAASDPASWEATTRYALHYDKSAEKYHFAMEQKDDATETWKPSLEIDGAWRLSDKSPRLELSVGELTVTTPVYDTAGKMTEKTAETSLELDLSLVWMTGDGTPVALPASATDLLGYTSEQIRELLDAGFDSVVTDLLNAAFGYSGDVLYTLDGVALPNAAYYLNYVEPYIALYEEYLAREGKYALSRLSIYDKTLNLYILLDYNAKDQSLAINFLNIFSDSYRAVYHTGKLVDGRLVGHQFVMSENIIATCKNPGRKERRCAVCQQRFTEETPALEHHMVTRSSLQTYDNGRQFREEFRYCEVCGAGTDAIWEAGGYYFTFAMPWDVTEVHLSRGGGYVTPYSTALTIPDYMDADSGGKLPVTQIGMSAFDDSSFAGLEIVRMGRNIREISTGSFSGATGLQVLVLYPALEKIGESTFADCTALRRVYFCGTEAQWKQIKIERDNEPLTNAEIIFEHDGSAVGDDVISLSTAHTALRTLIADSRDGKQGATLATHPNAERLTVLSTPAAQAVAYDADTDTVMVCGYDSTAAETTVSFFDAASGAMTDTRTLPYRINAMDAGNGYVAFGERSTPTVHLFRLSDWQEIASYQVKYSTFDDDRDYIGYLFIDNGIVVACNTEQHCLIDFYKIKSGTHVQSETIYQPALALDKNTHTLAAINQDSTPKSLYFYDTQTGRQITWHWNVETSAPIRWTGSVFETSRQYYSVAGQIVGAPTATLPTTETDSVTLEIMTSGAGYVFWAVAEQSVETGEVKAGVRIRTTSRSLTEPIPFYGDQVTQMGNGKRFLLWGEGYREILIVNLNW